MRNRNQRRRKRRALQKKKANLTSWLLNSHNKFWNTRNRTTIARTISLRPNSCRFWISSRSNRVWSRKYPLKSSRIPLNDWVQLNKRITILCRGKSSTTLSCSKISWPQCARNGSTWFCWLTERSTRFSLPPSSSMVVRLTVSQLTVPMLILQ